MAQDCFTFLSFIKNVIKCLHAASSELYSVDQQHQKETTLVYLSEKNT